MGVLARVVSHIMGTEVVREFSNLIDNVEVLVEMLGYEVDMHIYSVPKHTAFVCFFKDAKYIDLIVKKDTMHLRRVNEELKQAIYKRDDGTLEESVEKTLGEIMKKL